MSKLERLKDLCAVWKADGNVSTIDAVWLLELTPALLDLVETLHAALDVAVYEDWVSGPLPEDVNEAVIEALELYKQWSEDKEIKG